MATKEKKVEQKGKTLSGVVTSVSMKDTITVAVTRYVKHPKYKKFQKLTKKYLAHAPQNTAAVGDKATISECRPISKRKHFMLTAITKGKVLEMAGEEIAA
jgi:small subunit ribosomal protein S17